MALGVRESCQKSFIRPRGLCDKSLEMREILEVIQELLMLSVLLIGRQSEKGVTGFFNKEKSGSFLFLLVLKTCACYRTTICSIQKKNPATYYCQVLIERFYPSAQSKQHGKKSLLDSWRSRLATCHLNLCF